MLSGGMGCIGATAFEGGGAATATDPGGGRGVICILGGGPAEEDGGRACGGMTGGPGIGIRPGCAPGFIGRGPGGACGVRG